LEEVLVVEKIFLVSLLHSANDRNALPGANNAADQGVEEGFELEESEACGKSAKKEAADPDPVNKALEVGTLAEKVASIVRVADLVVVVVASANLAGKVKAECVEDKDSTEAEHIIQNQELVDHCKASGSLKHSHDHDELADNIDDCKSEEDLENIIVALGNDDPVCFNASIA